MIKAIIFDCFGVLTTEAFHALRDEYFAGSAQKQTAAKELMDSLNTGSITYKAFLDSIAALTRTSSQFVENYLSISKPNKPLLELISSTLKPKYKIGVLSNAGSDWLEKLFGKQGIKLFDDVVLSYQYKITKPNPGIYEIAARRLGAKPQECVFIDDNAGHCRGAEAVGMHAIWYKNFQETKIELETLLFSGTNN